MSVLILDIGSNHEGSKTRAKEMIHAVAENGGQIAKFQLFHQKQYPHNIALPEYWIPELEEYSNNLGLGFLLSYFYIPSFVPAIAKIAYSQRHNFDLIRWFEKNSTRLIVSGDNNTLWLKDCAKLLCIPKYPAPIDEYKNTHLYDGISDHTEGIEMALKYKPNILEKHFKLGDEKTSLDAGSFAMLPNELKMLSDALNG